MDCIKTDIDFWYWFIFKVEITMILDLDLYIERIYCFDLFYTKKTWKFGLGLYEMLHVPSLTPF